MNTDSSAAVQTVSLYQAHNKIYPRAVTGRFVNWRWALVWLTQIARDNHLPVAFALVQTDQTPDTWKRLLAHLDSRKDAQNIDLMNLAGFCRNCLSKWYAAAAAERG